MKVVFWIMKVICYALGARDAIACKNETVINVDMDKTSQTNLQLHFHKCVTKFLEKWLHMKAVQLWWKIQALIFC